MASGQFRTYRHQPVVVQFQASEEFQIDLVAPNDLQFVVFCPEQAMPVVIFTVVGIKISENKTGYCCVTRAGVEDGLGGHDKGSFLVVIAKGWSVFKHLPSRFMTGRSLSSESESSLKCLNWWGDRWST